MSSDQEPGEDRAGDENVTDEAQDLRESSAITPRIRDAIEERIVGERDSNDEDERRPDG